MEAGSLETTRMLLDTAFKRFVELAPMCVAARAVLEVALGSPELDQLFQETARKQYTRTLLFSTCVDLMASVVCRVHGSVHAAHRASLEKSAVSIRSIYNKLEHLEPNLSAELVRHTARKLTPVIRRMKGGLPPLLPGYRVKILDGNHLGRTQRRLKPLRDVAAGALPGQTLVVLDPELSLAIDVVCCEDGHAQERSLLDPILAAMDARDVYIADRNFCTTRFLFDIAERFAYFIIRQHASTLRWRRQSTRRRIGSIVTGTLYEQTLWLENESDETLPVRRITLVLNKPTRDGEKEIHLLTNLPVQDADAAKVAELYRERWSIEGLFQDLTMILQCEVNSLGYPKAALFGFCAALASSNVYATVKASLRGVHGADKVERDVSDHYLGVEISGKYEGMMIAIPEQQWRPLANYRTKEMADFLLRLARNAHLPRFQKHPRGPKKPKPRRTRFAKAKHVATARLLAQERRPK
jgi:Transposase DDE domain